MPHNGRMNSGLRLLSAGAAQGVAGALATRFRAETGAELSTAFMPVGVLKEKLLAGEACDVVVSTPPMLEQFALQGRVDGATIALLGRVPTGIAVRAEAKTPSIDTPDRLHAALSAAVRIHVPDPERATAGIHFVTVLRALGLFEALASRLASHPNGVAAMAALATNEEPGALGCTQVTEIRYTTGVALVGALPPPFDLATSYAASVCAAARDPKLARRFVDMLVGPDSAALRRDAGFEP
jgi:molybdate transport system substrate-binding protein